MDRKQVRISLSRLQVIALGLLVGLTSTARAEGPHAEGHHHKPCSNATLNGSYGYYRTGTILPEGGPLVAVGIITYDGIGNTLLTDSVNRNGELEFDQELFGRYQVNPDCSGMLFDEDGEEWARLVVVKGGNDVYVLSEHNPYYVVATKIDKD